MFKKIFPKEKFPTTLFVISSISALILLIIILIGLEASFGLSKIKPGQNGPSQAKYFLKENYKNDNEFITKNPTLKDLLARPIISPDDPQLGNADSPITIVEFSDFECKFCQAQEKVLKQAMAKYKLRLIWKDFPENNQSSVSFLAAVAARCAQQQNKFWEYHDLVFSGGQKLTRPLLSQYAQNLNLNTKKFEQCLNKKETNNLVTNNMHEANDLSISGIPFIYVNDQEIMGEISFEELSKIIIEKSK